MKYSFLNISIKILILCGIFCFVFFNISQDKLYAQTNCTLNCENINIREIAFIKKLDDGTKTHMKRVAKWTEKIAQELPYELKIKSNLHTIKDIKDLKKAAELHDIGKIAMLDIIKKEGTLTKSEFDTVKKHPTISKDIIRKFIKIDNENILTFVSQHHEKNDGSGYPYGLTEEKISLGTKVLTVADMYDAITSERSYHARNTIYTAKSILDAEVKSGKLDKDIVAALYKAVAKENNIAIIQASSYLSKNEILDLQNIYNLYGILTFEETSKEAQKLEKEIKEFQYKSKSLEDTEFKNLNTRYSLIIKSLSAMQRLEKLKHSNIRYLECDKDYTSLFFNSLILSLKEAAFSNSKFFAASFI